MLNKFLKKNKSKKKSEEIEDKVPQDMTPEEQPVTASTLVNEDDSDDDDDAILAVASPNTPSKTKKPVVTSSEESETESEVDRASRHDIGSETSDETGTDDDSKHTSTSQSSLELRRKPMKNREPTPSKKKIVVASRPQSKNETDPSSSSSNESSTSSQDPAQELQIRKVSKSFKQKKQSSEEDHFEMKAEKEAAAMPVKSRKAPIPPTVMLSEKASKSPVQQNINEARKKVDSRSGREQIDGDEEIMDDPEGFSTPAHLSRVQTPAAKASVSARSDKFTVKSKTSLYDADQTAVINEGGETDDDEGRVQAKPIEDKNFKIKSIRSHSKKSPKSTTSQQRKSRVSTSESDADDESEIANGINIDTKKRSKTPNERNHSRSTSKSSSILQKRAKGKNHAEESDEDSVSTTKDGRRRAKRVVKAKSLSRRIDKESEESEPDQRSQAQTNRSKRSSKPTTPVNRLTRKTFVSVDPAGIENTATEESQSSTDTSETEDTEISVPVKQNTKAPPVKANQIEFWRTQVPAEAQQPVPGIPDGSEEESDEEEPLDEILMKATLGGSQMMMPINQQMMQLPMNQAQYRPTNQMNGMPMMQQPQFQMNSMNGMGMMPQAQQQSMNQMNGMGMMPQAQQQSMNQMNGMGMMPQTQQQPMNQMNAMGMMQQPKQPQAFINQMQRSFIPNQMALMNQQDQQMGYQFPQSPSANRMQMSSMMGNNTNTGFSNNGNTIQMNPNMGNGFGINGMMQQPLGFNNNLSGTPMPINQAGFGVNGMTQQQTQYLQHPQQQFISNNGQMMPLNSYANQMVQQQQQQNMNIPSSPDDVTPYDSVSNAPEMRNIGNYGMYTPMVQAPNGNMMQQQMGMKAAYPQQMQMQQQQDDDANAPLWLIRERKAQMPIQQGTLLAQVNNDKKARRQKAKANVVPGGVFAGQQLLVEHIQYDRQRGQVPTDSRKVQALQHQQQYEQAAILNQMSINDAMNQSMKNQQMMQMNMMQQQYDPDDDKPLVQNPNGFYSQ